AANGKPVIFMGARHDDWRVQTADGFAAKIGGIASVSTDANGAWWGGGGVGTMPHSMIASFGGDVVRATLQFARYCREAALNIDVVSLTDDHIVVIIGKTHDVDVQRRFAAVSRELKRRAHHVATKRRDHRVRHRANASTAPPRAIRIRGDARDAANLRREPVRGLHAPVVVPGTHEDDGLPV